MTKPEAARIVKWIVGLFPSWLSRTAEADVAPTIELMVRQFFPLEYERTFERVRRLCYGLGRRPEDRAFAPAMAEILATLDIVGYMAIAAYDQAVLDGGELVRDPLNREAIDGWLYVPPGVSAPPPVKALPEPEPAREYEPPRRDVVDPGLAGLREGHRRGGTTRRLGEVLASPAREPREGEGQA